MLAGKNISIANDNPPSRKKEDEPSDFNFEIGSVNAKEGTFSYEREHLNHQNLTDINRFFLPNDGLELRGELVEGKSQVKVNGGSLSAFALAHYKDFNVVIRKNQDRGGLSAFFQNLMASLKMRKQNLESKNANRTGRATLKRERGQSIVSFILSGMKEAALKIPPKGDR